MYFFFEYLLFVLRLITENAKFFVLPVIHISLSVNIAFKT